MTNFTEKQRIQDEQYCFPYHYLDKQFEFYRGIIYADYLSLINRIIETIRPIEGMRLLDVGCGDGRLCYELSGKGAELTGVDYSVQAIAFARAFCPEDRFASLLFRISAGVIGRTDGWFGLFRKKG